MNASPVQCDRRSRAVHLLLKVVRRSVCALVMMSFPLSVSYFTYSDTRTREWLGAAVQLCARVAASASGPINTSSNKSIVAALLFGQYCCRIASSCQVRRLCRGTHSSSMIFPGQNLIFPRCERSPVSTHLSFMQIVEVEIKLKLKHRCWKLPKKYRYS